MLPSELNRSTVMKSSPFRMYSVGQIVLATFLGSALPGMWMLSRNLKHLGETRKATSYVYWGIGLTIANFALAFGLPESVPAISVSLPFVLVVRYLADRAIKLPLRKHIEAGGSTASWWSAIGYGLLSLVCVLILHIGVLLLLPISE
jgi:hypothetical protein